MTVEMAVDSAVVDAAERGETSELVRGSEQRLLERLAPLVRSQNVALDLDRIDRVDAAGLAALITLYCDALKSGHSFRVARPRRHVREILSLVGLDRILMTRGDGQARVGQSAA